MHPLIHDLPRRRSIRLPQYDYHNGGMYFVTICTKNRDRLFGEIEHGVIWMNTWGCIVADELQKTPIIRPYVHLDTWILMPNHLHALFYIHDHAGSLDARAGDLYGRPTGTPLHPTDLLYGRPTGTPLRDKPRMPLLKPQSLGSMIGQFKSISTKRINALRDTPSAPVWHRNYYERIIRSERELMNTRQYILNNPARWNKSYGRPDGTPS